MAIFLTKRRIKVDIKYRYVVRVGDEFIADCLSEECAADYCAIWVKERLLKALEDKAKTVFGGTFNLTVYKVEEK